MTRAEFNPLEMTSTPALKQLLSTKTDPLSLNTFASKQTLKRKESIIEIENLIYNFALLIYKPNEESPGIEASWAKMKKSLYDLFCRNFNMEVKSAFSPNMNEDEDLQKNYKIESGRTRLDELDEKKPNYDLMTSGDLVSKMEVLKRDMLHV